MIEFTSPRSIEALKRSDFRPEIFQAYSYQKTNCRCGLACLDIVLTAANKLKYCDDNLSSGAIEPYLESNPLDSRALEDIDDRTERYGGMSLLDVFNIGKRFFSTSNVVFGSSVSLIEIRELIRESIRSNRFVIVQFLASRLGLKLNGHFSVLAGYDSQTDMILIVDPARHRHGWYWAKMKDILEAAKTTMESSGVERGFVFFWD